MKSTLFRQLSTLWKPHNYQKKAVRFLLRHAAAALFLDPGLGKTSITLAAIKMLLKKGLIDKVLIIAPLRVCYNVWPAELEKWKDFNGLKMEILHGKDKQKILDRGDAQIYVINPEGIEWLLQVEKSKTPTGKIKVKVPMRRWKALGFDLLVIDELSKFKNHNTNRFKAMKLVIPTFKFRWGLTGSPAPNGLMNLFSQCYMLDEGRTLGKYISHYRMKYFTPSHDGFSWDLQEGADKKIFARLKPLVLRMDADDYIDMPKVIENNIKIELPDHVMEIYDRLEEDLIARIEGGVVTAATAAAASMKCRQVANGGIYMDKEVVALTKLPDKKRKTVDLHPCKVDALTDLVEELQGSPLLVAYDFGHDLERLKKAFGKDVPYIGGGVSAKRSKMLEDAWNMGDIPLLLGQPQSIGHGLNLQGAAQHVAWHSLTWDYEVYDQFIRRIRRQGNTFKRIFVHHLIAEGTVDEAIMGSIKAKRRGQNSLFSALKTLKTKKKLK